MKTRAWAVAIGLLGAWPAAAGAETVDGVAAIVGRKVILRSQLDLATRLLLERIQDQGGQLDESQRRELRMQALRQLIDDELILALAERNEAVASDAEIDQAIAGIAQEEGVTPDDVYRAAAAQGLGREAYREQLRREMTRMRVLGGSVRSRVAVSDEQVRALYEERYAKATPGERIRVLHLLLPIPAEATPEQIGQLEQVAGQLREQALANGDFAGLARRYSAAPSAPDGGLTVFRQGDAPPRVAAAIERLAPGEISPIVRTEHGFNLFQFLDRFDPSQVRFEEVEPQLRAELTERETMPQFQKFLDEVRKSRYVEIVNPEPR
jgi:peptidyl-prolyl cis-trans isomerase SurA